LENVANFLAELHDLGYEYRSINNFRSAISAFHPEIGGIKVGQTSLIKHVMTGIFNLKPPLPRYNETWDVDQVLKYLNTLDQNEELTLKVLSHKVVTLMALTSASRSSELHKLDIRFMQITPGLISFTLTGLIKTTKVNDGPIVLSFADNENEKLSAEKCILHYLDRTNVIRGEETQLLISHIKPHKAVKTCTIASWLKNALTNAGIDTSVFKAHSTRGASTSKANKFGISVGQIMKQANWRSANTFQRFYNKPIQGNVNQEFAQAVLDIK
jgi:integrase